MSLLSGREIYHDISDNVETIKDPILPHDALEAALRDGISLDDIIGARNVDKTEFYRQEEYNNGHE